MDIRFPSVANYLTIRLHNKATRPAPRCFLCESDRVGGVGGRFHNRTRLPSTNLSLRVFRLHRELF